MSEIIRARYEGGVFKPLEKVNVEEGEEVEMIIKRRVFTERDYREITKILDKVPKGKTDLLDAVEELYYEALR